jgi:hypothetical protein
MAINFADIQDALRETGSIEFLLPFAILFALVLGVLRRTEIIDDNPAQVLLSAALAGYVAFYNDALFTFLSATAPALGMGLMLLLGVLVLAGLVGGDDLLSLGDGGTNWFVYAMLGVVALLTWGIFAEQDIVQQMPFIGSLGGGESITGGVVAVVLILALIGWAIKGEED